MRTDAYDTREKRQAIYDYYADSLRQMVADAAGHASNCDAAPLCIGGQAMEILDVLYRVQPTAAVLYTAVAVRELIRAGEQHASMTQRMKALLGRLEAQRGLTADAVGAAAAFEEERDALLYRVDELEKLVGTMVNEP